MYKAYTAKLLNCGGHFSRRGQQTGQAIGQTIVDRWGQGCRWAIVPDKRQDRSGNNRGRRQAGIIAIRSGYDNIDIEAATQRGIVVTNTPGVLTDATADLVWALMFAVARRIVESDRFARAGMYESWSPTLLLGQEIRGKRLGIIGAGRIGRAVAKRSRGFDMEVVYTGRTRNIAFELEMGAIWTDRETLLRTSDFVSVNVPLNADTYHLIGKRELDMMKSTAILINTSRGPVVDEKALVDALNRGSIWGAGLDVYEREPEIDEGLKKLDNVVITPHIGSATTEARTKMALMAAKNIVAVLSGNKPINPVNHV